MAYTGSIKSLIVFALVVQTGAAESAALGPAPAAPKASLHHETAEEAAAGVMKAAKTARKMAHGDGSDSFANGLEESMLDLEEMKHEMEEKQKERHANLEKQKQAIHAHYQHVQEEIQLDHQERELEMAEERRKLKEDQKEMEKEMEKLEKSEEERKKKKAQDHKRSDDHALATDQPSPKDKADQTAVRHAETPVESHPTLRLGLFFVAALALAVLMLLISLSRHHADVLVVDVPGLGTVKMGQWASGLLKRMKGSPASIYSSVYTTGEDRSTLAPLQPRNGAKDEAGAGYGGLV